jgi:hypothetical protein
LTLKKTSVFSPVDDWAAEEANIAPAAVLFEAARGCAHRSIPKLCHPSVPVTIKPSKSFLEKYYS